MTVADAYRRFAAECVAMSQRHESINEKALFIEMAMMWLRLAEVADRNEGTDDLFTAS
jgi:hypothetical protein